MVKPWLPFQYNHANIPVMPINQPSTCPECQGELFFTPDGQYQQCDRCGYRYDITVASTINISELDEAIRFSGVGRPLYYDESDGDSRMSSGRRIHRDMLAQGISAVRENKMAEAYYYLSKLLKMGNTHEDERLSAWMWLSAVAETFEESEFAWKTSWP